MGDKNRQRRRRKWGTGSISQRADGYWRGRIDAGYSANGKRYRPEVVARTEAECRRKLKALQAQYAESGSQMLQGRNITVRRWLEQWLENKSNIASGTHSLYSGFARRIYIPLLGRRRLIDLSPNDIRAMMNAVKASGGSSRYVNTVKTILLGALKDAQGEGISISPTVFAVKNFQTAEVNRAAIPIEDVHKLLEECKRYPGGARWYVAFMYGLRPAEGTGLEDCQIDFKAKTVSIEWQLQSLKYADREAGTFRIPEKSEPRRLEGATHLIRPKTKATRRTLPFIGEMDEILKLWFLERPGTIHGLAFPYISAAGTIQFRTNNRDNADFVELQKRAKVSKADGSFYTAHEIRHTTVSLLNEMGVDAPTIAKIVGHGSIQSQGAYMHVAEPHVADTLASFGKMLQDT